jgi:hypothetical protein
MTSDRGRWVRAVKSADFPRDLRSIRATLLCLVDVMSAEGVLSASRDRLADVTGLPVRTLNRHLGRAVEAGWLVHVVHGGNGRRSRYMAVIPNESCGPLSAYNDEELRATYSSATLPELRANWWPTHIDRASVGEHVAVDNYRHRRLDHDGSRVSPEHCETKDGIEGQIPSNSPLAAISPARLGREALA